VWAGNLRHTDRKAQRATHKRHDAIKRGEGDGDHQEHQHHRHTDRRAGEGPEPLGRGAVLQMRMVAIRVVRMVVMVRVAERTVVEAQEHLDRGHDRTRVERDLGQRDDGDAHAHEEGQGAWVAGFEEDVGGDLVADVVAEHEKAGDGGGCVEEVLCRRLVAGHQTLGVTSWR
jgi:hypothetical protein